MHGQCLKLINFFPLNSRWNVSRLANSCSSRCFFNSCSALTIMTSRKPTLWLPWSDLTGLTDLGWFKLRTILNGKNSQKKRYPFSRFPTTGCSWTCFCLQPIYLFGLVPFPILFWTHISVIRNCKRIFFPCIIPDKCASVQGLFQITNNLWTSSDECSKVPEYPSIHFISTRARSESVSRIAWFRTIVTWFQSNARCDMVSHLNH